MGEYETRFKHEGAPTSFLITFFGIPVVVLAKKKYGSFTIRRAVTLYFFQVFIVKGTVEFT